MVEVTFNVRARDTNGKGRMAIITTRGKDVKAARLLALDRALRAFGRDTQKITLSTKKEDQLPAWYDDAQ